MGGSQPLDHHSVAQICYGRDLIMGVQNKSDGQEGRGSTAAALVAGKPFPRRCLAGEGLGGALGLGLGRGLAGEVASGMRSPLGAKGRLLGARTGLVAERGGASSPEHGVRPREGATDCTNTPKGSASGGYSHRGSNSGDGVAQGAGGVSLAAELDGAWRRGRRRAWSRGSGLGGVRGLRAELSRRLAVVGASGSAGNAAAELLL